MASAIGDGAKIWDLNQQKLGCQMWSTSRNPGFLKVRHGNADSTTTDGILTGDNCHKWMFYYQKPEDNMIIVKSYDNVLSKWMFHYHIIFIGETLRFT